MTRPYSGLNTNKERREFWEHLAIEKGKQWIEESLTQIDPTNAKVLAWHYNELNSFAEITMLLKRSISIVRNHHNRGIFELQQYYLKQRKGL